MGCKVSIHPHPGLSFKRDLALVRIRPSLKRGMEMKRRSSRGQSMVEYALGLGCVAALCMVALGSLGHMNGHMIHEIEEAINYSGPKSAHPNAMVNVTATPWNIN